VAGRGVSGVKVGAARLVLAALALACVFPSVALATRVSLFGPDTRFGFRAEIEVNGTRGPNRISIDYLPTQGTFVVTDPTGITASGCELAGRTRARCVAPANSRVEVHAKGGSDRVAVARVVKTRVQADGGSGEDVITGGSGDDQLMGSGGDDVLRGKGGDDSLGGLFDSGHDEFFGGSGDDDIDSSEHRSEPDKVIDCGPGNRDDAFVDEKRDPKPTGCEDVVDT
jgi:RTX calcium-binding nonapeptide repeat (4 copies)